MARPTLSGGRPTPRVAFLAAPVGWLLILAAAGWAGSGTPAAEAQTRVVAAWLQKAPGDAVLVRAVSSGPTCPTVVAGGATIQPAVRAVPALRDFPLPVCEAILPPDAFEASFGDSPLPVPHGVARRIVVIGDAGCRLEEGDPVQDCDDPRAWPFAQVARSAAAWRPDLVVHVGDYVYREAPCPPKIVGCAGTPWGDNWAAWQADLFAPAAPLLRAAPWVFARGNHEICSRGGDGWFRLLDARPYTGTCDEYTEPYAVDLGDLRLVLVDSAQADDFSARPDEVAVYAAQFARVGELAGPNTWLVQHRPLWAIGQDPRNPTPEGLYRTNPTLQAASGNALPPGVQLVLSGHVHIWEALTFADGRPPQLVTGNAGTTLDPLPRGALSGVAVAGTTVASGTALRQWGFTTLERTDAAWLATLRDAAGDPLLTCTFADRDLSCSP